MFTKQVQKVGLQVVTAGVFSVMFIFNCRTAPFGVSEERLLFSVAGEAITVFSVFHSLRSFQVGFFVFFLSAFRR